MITSVDLALLENTAVIGVYIVPSYSATILLTLRLGGQIAVELAKLEKKDESVRINV